MPKSFALVVVKNGLGHLRRQLHFYEYLVRYGYTVKLFCHLPDLVRIGAKNINADELEIEVSDLPELVKTQFFEGLKSRLKTYDVVVSDNCIEILRAREDAVIFASFLWHLSIDFPKDYIRASENLLRKNAPLIIANGIFAANYLYKYTNVHFVGLFGNLMGAKHEDASDILVAFGHSDEIRAYFTHIVEAAYEICRLQDRTLLVEPRYYDHLGLESPLVKCANFTAEMYRSVDVGVIRPGVGTLSELLASRSKIVCVYEQGNGEMIENSQTLTRLGLGLEATNLQKLRAVLRSIDDIPRISQDEAQYAFQGAEQALRVIELHG